MCMLCILYKTRKYYCFDCRCLVTASALCGMLPKMAQLNKVAQSPQQPWPLLPPPPQLNRADTCSKKRDV